MDTFTYALENLDLESLKKTPKADIHNHSGLGYKYNRIKPKWGDTIPAPENQISSIEQMNSFIIQYLRPYYSSIEGYAHTLELTFKEALEDGISFLEMSFDLNFLKLFDNKPEIFASFIDTIHQRIAPEIILSPEIGLDRQLPIHQTESLILSMIENGYFKSIDLYGDEYKGDLKSFRPLFLKAKEKGLKCKAHAGEYRDAEFIRQTVELLEVTQIQHGINSVKSTEVMHWLRNNNIQLNICPSSNIILQRVDNIKNHPIRTIADVGIKVTVNTDDIFFFNQTVSEELLNLYIAELFTSKELNQIRLNGLPA